MFMQRSLPQRTIGAFHFSEEAEERRHLQHGVAAGVAAGTTPGPLWKQFSTVPALRARSETSG